MQQVVEAVLVLVSLLVMVVAGAVVDLVAVGAEEASVVVTVE